MHFARQARNGNRSLRDCAAVSRFIALAVKMHIPSDLDILGVRATSPLLCPIKQQAQNEQRRLQQRTDLCESMSQSEMSDYEQRLAILDRHDMICR